MTGWPEDKEKEAMTARLRRLRLLGRLTLLRERLTVAFWRPACWLMLFAGLWLWRAPSALGPVGDIAALLLFTAGFLWLAVLGLRAYRHPRPDEIDRRLEEAGALPHRPLEQIGDTLFNADKDETRRLWHKGRGDAWQVLHRLRRARAQPVLAAADPLALRLFAALILLSGVLVAGGAWRERLVFGLTPLSVQWQDKAGDNITLWITPPPYTRLPQVTLQGRGRASQTIDVAQDSVIKVRVRNGWGRPHLRMGDRDLPLETLGEKSWGLETVAAAAPQIEIRQLLRTRASIPIRYIKDTPPVLTLAGEPQALPRGALQLRLTAQDDYGVSALDMSMTLDPSVTDAPPGAPVTETRPVMSPPGKPQDLRPVYDLTGHPWAGLKVMIALKARDKAGNETALAPFSVTLPVRTFYHPVAQAVIALRQRLIWTPEAAAENVAYDLEKLLSHPDSFGGDLTVFLSLRSAASHLIYDQSPKAAEAVAAQLWNTALRIEDGNLSMAERNLRDAQQQMQSLLADPEAPPEAIAAAAENLKQAMASYMQEVYTQMQKNAAAGMRDEDLDPAQFAQTLDMRDLAEFFDQLQARALAGDREAAQQMMAQMQQMMDNLDPSLSMTPPPEMQQLMQSIAGMKELIAEQEDLLTRTKAQAAGLDPATAPPRGLSDYLPFEPGTFEGWGDDGAMPPPPQETAKTAPPADNQSETALPDTSVARKTQEDIRRRLGEIMLETGDKLGEIPDGMQKAEGEMRGAVDDLASRRPAEAAAHQEKALEHLKHGQESLNKQLAALMKQMTLLTFGAGPRDPLGRPMRDGKGNALMPGSEVKLPDEAERKRIRDILDTLRRRSGDYSRPDYELDYYRRLMRQF